MLVVHFDSKKRSLLNKLKGNVALSIRRNLPVRLQFTHGTLILLRMDVLRVMPSHPVIQVFLKLQWNSLGRAPFKVHESQRDLRLGKLVFQMLLSGECLVSSIDTHNCRIWGSKNSRVYLEHVHDNPKVNVFCAPSKERECVRPLLLHGED
jgi:hypothetical protein